MKQVAFGPLNLKPDEFWRLTLGEFNDLAKGYEWREKAAMQKLAWHAANVMNVHLKKPIEPERLLKPPQTGDDKQRELEKIKAEVERVAKRRANQR